MALQTDFTLDDGTFFEDAYLRIVRYSGDKGDGELNIHIWKSEEEKNAKLQPIQTRDYSFNYDLESVDNILVQGYEYLKTCPEFANSIDV